MNARRSLEEVIGVMVTEVVSDTGPGECVRK